MDQGAMLGQRGHLVWAHREVWRMGRGVGNADKEHGASAPPPPHVCSSHHGSHLLHQTHSSLRLLSLSPASFPSSLTHSHLSRLKNNRKAKRHRQPPTATAFSPSFRANFLKAFSPLTVSSPPSPPHSLFHPLQRFAPLPTTETT